MFGNPDYFQIKQGRVPAPKNVSGWLFYIVWLAAIFGPCLGMFLMSQYIQLIVWLVISVSWFCFDLFSTSRQIRRKVELEQLFFVGDEDSHVSTQNYDLNLRQSTSNDK